MRPQDRIKMKREEKGWSQEQLAEKIGLKSGRSSVAHVENSKSELSPKTIQKYADALGVSFFYLMGWTDKEQVLNPDYSKYISGDGSIEAEIIKALENKTIAQKAAILTVIKSM